MKANYSFSLNSFKSEPSYQVTALFTYMNDHIEIKFIVEGDIHLVELERPRNLPSKRVKGLWERTCFEVFLMAKSLPHYIELNFSPSGDWNCFSFSKIRGELKELTSFESPKSSLSTQEGRIEFTAKFSCFDIPKEILSSSAIRLNLSAVIKESENKKSYFAISHSESLDFHNPENFVSIELI